MRDLRYYLTRGGLSGNAKTMKSNSVGFTIVELLIVIVVIGVLAAIVIVAYGGVQQRASNAQRIAAAKDWVKTIKSYTTINQKFPVPGSGQFYCIGDSNITDFDANPDSDCGLSNNLKHDSTSTVTFNATIKTIAPQMPAFPGKPVQMTTTDKGLGMLLRTDTYDPSGENIVGVPTLTFFLEGANQDCVLGPLVSAYAGGNFVKVTGKNSASFVGTACRIMLEE